VEQAGEQMSHRIYCGKEDCPGAYDDGEDTCGCEKKPGAQPEVELAKPICAPITVYEGDEHAPVFYLHCDIAAERIGHEKEKVELRNEVARLMNEVAGLQDTGRKLYALDAAQKKEIAEADALHKIWRRRALIYLAQIDKAEASIAELKEDLEHFWCTAGVGCAQTRIREIIDKHFRACDKPENDKIGHPAVAYPYQKKEARNGK
jgi:hypothetical protein